MQAQDRPKSPPRNPRRVPMKFAGQDIKLYAGPFLSYRGHKSRPLRVNLAAEIPAISDITVPTQDFGTPDLDRFLTALRIVADSLLGGRPVFVGCRFGQGRTGMFLAALLKLSNEVSYRLGGPLSQEDPIYEVRRIYYYRAVETVDQEEFVRRLKLRRMSMCIAFWMSPGSIFNKRFWVQLP